MAAGDADVIVIGAGAAGCVLAARLSEDRSRHVLLLEAGSDERAAETPPEIFGASFQAAVALPGRTWPTLVARRTAGQEPRVYLRGRGVGGSAAINAMVALTGERDDYDSWATEFGCAGWACATWHRGSSGRCCRAGRLLSRSAARSAEPCSPPTRSPSRPR